MEDTRTTRHLGVPGMILCQRNLTAARRAPHNVKPGTPRIAPFLPIRDDPGPDHTQLNYRLNFN
jgi:hypothetical protein